MRTRIKICGLTREQDVSAAIEAGVDALGFVFYKKSPRFLSPERARELIDICPAWVCKVGLFVNSSQVEINRISQISGINQIQLHGDEILEDCLNLKRPIIKALRINDKKHLNRSEYDNLIDQLIESKKYLKFCDAILLDSNSSQFGGSGQSFNWNILDDVYSILGNKWVLSGGLSIENVSLAIKSFRPPAIDISSGVEVTENGILIKGVKDKQKIKKFVNAVHDADNKT